MFSPSFFIVIFIYSNATVSRLSSFTFLQFFSCVFCTKGSSLSPSYNFIQKKSIYVNECIERRGIAIVILLLFSNSTTPRRRLAMWYSTSIIKIRGNIYSRCNWCRRFYVRVIHQLDTDYFIHKYQNITEWHVWFCQSLVLTKKVRKTKRKWY